MMLLATLASAALASADDTAMRLDELERELAELRAGRTADVRAIVRDALADASTRTSLRADDGTAGYLDGFFVSSTDGAFVLRLRVLEQVRWSFNDRGVDGDAQGFQNTRTRLGFEGSVVDPSWTYSVAYELGSSNSVEDFGPRSLADAFVMKSTEDGLRVRVGQFRQPFSAEYALDIAAIAFIEYSVIESLFGAGYGQGVELGFDGDDLRARVAFTNALEEANASWSATSPGTDWAIAARAEAKLAGTWRQFRSAGSLAGEGFGLRLGGAVAAERPDAAGSDDEGRWTIDFAAEFGGTNASIAYFQGWNLGSNAAFAGDSSPSGWLAAVGVYLAEDLELVGRYEWASADFSTLTVGLNRWFTPAIRLGVDAGYAFDAITPSLAPFAEANNWLVDPAGDSGQCVVRAQLTLSF